MPKGWKISVTNQKGGVGKTTTAVNLAACLAAAERRVLLVDLDPQANASSSFSRLPEEGRPDIYNVLVDETPIGEIITSSAVNGLDIAPASKQLAGAEVELVSMLARELRLKTALEAVRSTYDYIIFDCPPALGLLTINALAAADSVLIPVQTEYFALEGVGRLIDTISRVRRSLNPQLEVEGVVLTMADMRTNLSKQVSEEISSYFGDKLFKTIITRNIRLSEAPSHGQSIIEYDIGSKGSEAYLEFAAELLQRHEGRNIKES